VDRAPRVAPRGRKRWWRFASADQARRRDATEGPRFGGSKSSRRDRTQGMFASANGSSGDDLESDEHGRLPLRFGGERGNRVHRGTRHGAFLGPTVTSVTSGRVAGGRPLRWADFDDSDADAASAAPARRGPLPPSGRRGRTSHPRLRPRAARTTERTHATGKSSQNHRFGGGNAETEREHAFGKSSQNHRFGGGKAETERR
jgi:hypothetical protein